jgi:hypothetical protein
MMWHRVLSPQEIQQLYIDPYGFIEPKKTWWTSAVETATGFMTTNKGYW